MKYLLDSDILSFLYDVRRGEHHESVCKSLQHLAPTSQVLVTVLSLCELEYSYSQAPLDKQKRIRTTIDRIQANFDIEPITEDIAFILWKIKSFS